MKNTFVCSLGLVWLALAALPVGAQNQTWIRQFGTDEQDAGSAAAPDGVGGVYVGGLMRWSPPFGGTAWLARYDGAGTQTWIRELYGEDGSVASISQDGAGGAYVCGGTYGNLGGPNHGLEDAWIAHYDAAGNQTWIRQLGTNGQDRAYAASPDSLGGVYVGGSTGGNLGGPNVGSDDAWLARYDSAGNQSWIRHLGTSMADKLLASAPDASGGVYVGGSTSGSLGGPNAGNGDAWLARYDNAGNQTWIRQAGTSDWERAFDAAPDGSGGVYLAGSTAGSFGGPSAGWYDAWLAHYDDMGNQTWVRQLGTAVDDEAVAAASDGIDGVFVGGNTSGSLGGPNHGIADAWIAHYDSAGNQAWITQLGTGDYDGTFGLAFDGTGGVYACGETFRNLVGPYASGYPDAWLARYDPCGIIVSYCTAGTTSNNCVPSIAGSGSASASTGSGFTITVSNVEGAQNGMLFFGLSGPIAKSWGTSASLLCVKSPTQRTPAQPTSGTVSQCDGVLSIDWNAFIANNPGALGTPFIGGETVYAQGWFRDPPAPKTTNLSNGLMFSVCP